jgi:hypothetical protein
MRMSNSSLVSVRVPAYNGNYTKGRSGRKIEAITIHHMAGRLTAAGCGRIFQKVGRCGSSHYGIGYNGEIGQYVDENDTAWTNSNWDSNCKSVTIETSDNDNSWYVNDTTLNSLIKLVADIAKRNNLGTLVKGKNVTWHSMFTNTDCPGSYLLSKMDYIIAEANKINSGASSSSDVNVFYRVKTQKHGWLPEVKNLEDYAGYQESPITDVAIGVDKGTIRYRVHLKGGNWLPFVTGYNISDAINGYAGNGKPIDAIEVYYNTPYDIRPYKKAKYKVNNYPWQYDNEKTNGQDGYAGAFGVNVTKFQIVIE